METEQNTDIGHYGNPIRRSPSDKSSEKANCPFWVTAVASGPTFFWTTLPSKIDWTKTKKLHDKIKTPCHCSLFVIGPSTTLISDTAVNTSNAIAIASGCWNYLLEIIFSHIMISHIKLFTFVTEIGITTTLLHMQSYAGKKRINDIWMCWDYTGLIQFIIHKFDITAMSA